MEYQLPHEGLTNQNSKQLVSTLVAYLIGNAVLENRDRQAYDPKRMAIAHEVGHAIVMKAMGEQPARVFVSDNGGVCERSEIARREFDLDSLSRNPFLLLPDLMIMIAGYAGESVYGQDEQPPTHFAAHEIAMVFYLCQVMATHTEIPAIKIYTAVFNATCELLKNNAQHAKSLLSQLNDRSVVAGKALKAILSEVGRLDPCEAYENSFKSDSAPNELFADICRVLILASEAEKEFEFARGLPMNERLAKIASRHSRIVVGFSGGKESVVLAEMLKSFKGKVELVWVNTGAMFPHMIDFVRSYGNEFKLIELTSNQRAHWTEAGLPSTIVPLSYVPIKNHDNSGRFMINDWNSCCYKLRTKPMYDYIRQTGATLFIHGEKKEDKAYFNPEHELNGVEVLAPLYDWSEAEVISYIDQHSLTLPEQYPEVMDSLECWSCTASLSEPRFRFMKRRYPELVDQVTPLIKAIYGGVVYEMNKQSKALEVAFR